METGLRGGIRLLLAVCHFLFREEKKNRVIIMKEEPDSESERVRAHP